MNTTSSPLARRRLLMGALALTALAAQAATIEVPVLPARPTGVSTGYELDGIVQPVRQATLSALASGRVVTLAVRAGDRVRAGQVLATIDDREASAAVQRAQAQSAQAEAEWRNAQANEKRTRELREKGFVSQAALDQAQTQLQAAQAGRDQAAAGVRQSQVGQGHARVVAPFDGFVLQTHAEVGDLALPGKPLMTVYAPQPLRAVVQVPQTRAVQAREATAIEVRLPSGEWTRPVARTTLPAADPVSQTVEWRLDLSPQAAAALLPGQDVRVRFVGGSAQRTVVPAQAVLRRGELTAVYVASGQGFVLKAVRLGADHGAAGVEVLAGLSPEDRVALDPVRAGLTGARPKAAP